MSYDNSAEIGLLLTLKQLAGPGSPAAPYLGTAINRAHTARPASDNGDDERRHREALLAHLAANGAAMNDVLRRLSEGQRQADSLTEFRRNWDRMELKQTIAEVKALIAQLTPPEPNIAEVLGTPTENQRANDDAYWSSFAETHDDPR